MSGKDSCSVLLGSVVDQRINGNQISPENALITSASDGKLQTKNIVGDIFTMGWRLF